MPDEQKSVQNEISQTKECKTGSGVLSCVKSMILPNITKNEHIIKLQILNKWVSGLEESHLQALSEPGVSLSAHRAPIIQPPAKSPFASGQTTAGHDERSGPANAPRGVYHLLEMTHSAANQAGEERQSFNYNYHQSKCVQNCAYFWLINVDVES